MDEQGQASMFQEAVTESMAGRTMTNFNDFENVAGFSWWSRRDMREEKA